MSIKTAVPYTVDSDDLQGQVGNVKWAVIHTWISKEGNTPTLDVLGGVDHGDGTGWHWDAIMTNAQPAMKQMTPANFFMFLVNAINAFLKRAFTSAPVQQPDAPAPAEASTVGSHLASLVGKVSVGIDGIPVLPGGGVIPDAAV